MLNNSIDSNEVTENNLLADDINKVMEMIPSRESKVLRMRHGFDGDPLSYNEIGRIMGVSRERIRQIEANALRRLRGYRIRKYFVDYVREKAYGDLANEKNINKYIIINVFTVYTSYNMYVLSFW